MNRRTFLRGSALAIGAVCLDACSAAPVVVEVATVVTVAATLAESATENVAKFIDAYFAVHADPALQAKIDSAMQRVKDGAAALAALGNGALEVAEAQYVAALDSFRSAYADILDMISALPSAAVVLTTAKSMTMTSQPGTMTLVAMPPSVFVRKMKVAR